MLGALGAVVLAAAAPAAVLASGDSEDHLLPNGKVIHMALASGTKVTFTAVQNGVLTVSVSCTTSTTSFTSGAPFEAAKSQFGPFAIAKPTFTNCTGPNPSQPPAVTVSGSWAAIFHDAASDETATEPNTGDKITLLIPKAGITINPGDPSAPTCTVVVAPNGAGVHDGS
jgi:hypothetical protein